ncbi:MAG: hypothetical protein ACI8Y7_001100 [Candidatus Woesearchaeota archaeon]|jgi:hypothetical protein
MRIALLFIVLIFLVACTSEFSVNSFAECEAAGNPAMESYPRQCMHEGITFIEDISNVCTSEYRPVCGAVQVQCITTPCDPIQTTFSNECEAQNANAAILYEGACKDVVALEEACLSFDGTWLGDSQECEDLGKEECTNLGGAHNECASACRNDPESAVCTLQCIIVCDFS